MQSYIPNGGLTWYRGSIPPYSSLWLTLIRLGALNRLNLSQLQAQPISKNAEHVYRNTWYPLFNDWNTIDTSELSKVLGETPECMAWSHLGHISPWLRGYFTRTLRFCQSCLSQGYHSSLYSLVLLEVCPIHGEELLNGCKCGWPIQSILGSKDFKKNIECPHCKNAFIDSENCRIPKIAVEQTRALDEIVKFLEELESVFKTNLYQTPKYAGVTANADLSISAWCEIFNIEYPKILTESTPHGHSVCIASGGPFHSTRKDQKNRIEKSRPDKYWSWETPALLTYRSVCRHIRRHCWSDDIRIQQKHTTPYDYAKELMELVRDPNFTNSFTEYQWARHLEDNVHLRRWPYRNPSNYSDQKFRVDLEMIGLRDFPSPDIGTRTWLEYHRGAYYILSVWAFYKARTDQMVLAGNSMGRFRAKPPAPVWDWAAKFQPDGSVLFACLKTKEPFFPLRLRRPKSVRIDEIRSLKLKKDKEVQAVCSGPCLTWSHRDGWTATTAIAPDGLLYKRHNLLGGPNEKPKFLLYLASGGYVARLENVALQVVEQSPREAISTLKIAYALYRRWRNLEYLRSPYRENLGMIILA